MKPKLKIEHLENYLQYLQKKGYMNGLILYRSDGIIENKVSLARKLDFGAIDIITGFVTFSEMNNLLRGYEFAKINKF